MSFFTPRRLAILAVALLSGLVLFKTLSDRTSDALEWPISVAETSEEISLSEVREMINTPVEGRRAGVLGRFLYVETPLAAMSGPDDGSREVDLSPTIEGGDSKTVRAQMPYPAHYLISDIAAEGKVPLQVYENPSYQVSWVDRLIQLLPLMVIIGIVLFIVARGATKGLGLNSSFEVIERDKLKSGFEDVAGIDTARGEIQEIVDFLKAPEDAARLGGRMPKGAIFSGPPGTGKTLLARAMAKEAGVPFLSIEASGINQLFVGAGSMKIKRAFREARKRAPCIVFIDEIDAMGRARGQSHSGASDEKETTLNALLVELDGFDSREGVVVIAATNRPEILDPALTRRGRIDRRIHIDLPDQKGREEILEVHARTIKTYPVLDLAGIAATTFGFSGADLAALVNEAALLATRGGKEYVERADFDAARDRLVVGLSGSQRQLNATDRHLTAVHEAGHAMVAAALPHADGIEKATILPQGGALGFVMQSPDEDRVFETRAHLIARVRVAVAGRVAEETVFGPDGITSGASSDIQAATRIARNMVARFGMAGDFVLVDPEDPLLYDPKGGSLGQIRHIIEAEMEAVRKFVHTHRDTLDRLAQALETHETLSGVQVCEVVGDLPFDTSTTGALAAG